jgi:hypothetical protein
MWRSSPSFQQPEGDKKYVANLLGVSGGDEVTARLRSTSSMVDASRAGKLAAKLALSMRDGARERATWADHEPWLWRVGEAEPPLYVFGSLSLVSVDGVEELGPRVLEALETSERLGLAGAARRMSRKQLIGFGLRSSDEPPASEVLSEAGMATLRKHLGDRISVARMDRFGPELLLLELVHNLSVSQFSGMSTKADKLDAFNSSMVRQFEVAAKARDKTIEYRVDLDEELAKIGDVVSYRSLGHVTERFDEIRVRLNLFKEAYDQRSVDKLRNNLIDVTFGLTPEAPGFRELMEHSTDRWLSTIKQRASEGGSLFVMPVSVMVKEGGIADKLREAGYTVTLLE